MTLASGLFVTYRNEIKGPDSSKEIGNIDDFDRTSLDDAIDLKLKHHCIHFAQLFTDITITLNLSKNSDGWPSSIKHLTEIDYKKRHQVEALFSDKNCSECFDWLVDALMPIKPNAGLYLDRSDIEEKIPAQLTGAFDSYLGKTVTLQQSSNILSSLAHVFDKYEQDRALTAFQNGPPELGVLSDPRIIEDASFMKRTKHLQVQGSDSEYV